VNLWLPASAALLLCLVPCAIGVVRGTIADRLIALEAATVVSVLTLLTLEQGLERQSFFDLSLAMAVLMIPSTLLFARFYRRWL
jgi:multisubunit Na+/H+ antiporter MnhF subunit